MIILFHLKLVVHNAIKENIKTTRKSENLKRTKT